MWSAFADSPPSARPIGREIDIPPKRHYPATSSSSGSSCIVSFTPPLPARASASAAALALRLRLADSLSFSHRSRKRAIVNRYSGGASALMHYPRKRTRVGRMKTTNVLLILDAAQPNFLFKLTDSRHIVCVLGDGTRILQGAGRGWLGKDTREHRIEGLR